MQAWLIRVLFGAVALVLIAVALGSRGVEPAPAPATPTAPPAADQPQPTLAPVPAAVPTATSAPFVERIISRISRETPAPYPTSTPLPEGVAFVSMVDFAYMPSVVRIKPGQTVVWSNGGRELHDVTGEDWYSGPVEPPATYRHTFGFAGRFAYRCSVHPDMLGTVIVAE